MTPLPLQQRLHYPFATIINILTIVAQPEKERERKIEKEKEIQGLTSFLSLSLDYVVLYINNNNNNYNFASTLCSIQSIHCIYICVHVSESEKWLGSPIKFIAYTIYEQCVTHTHIHMYAMLSITLELMRFNYRGSCSNINFFFVKAGESWWRSRWPPDKITFFCWFFVYNL